MKFTLATIALVAPAVLAAPKYDTDTAVSRLTRDMTPRADFNEAEVFAFAPPASCSILSCIDVISQAVCIAEAIDDEDWQGIFKCANRKELCGCAGCFSALGNFLERYGLC
ncbi:hypothetical protein MMYC01_201929 [Madurella mycetomatis]|uniref:Fungal calcium binding protein domain-containing protein n=1 Tax=Madurella mycetomatis TaxID=100816 RepID=A0A175WDW3_9PEZI|nr:hypothetical protein MMYC01_201929 [Madurella mycetomatis]